MRIGEASRERGDEGDIKIIKEIKEEIAKKKKRKTDWESKRNG